MSPIGRITRRVRLRPPPVADKGSKTKRSGRQVRHAPSERNVGHRKRGIWAKENIIFINKLNKQGCCFKLCLRNQQCEPKKISVRKAPKPQRFRGFVMPFCKVKFKRYHFPKTTFGEGFDLNSGFASAT